MNQSKFCEHNLTFWNRKVVTREQAAHFGRLELAGESVCSECFRHLEEARAPETLPAGMPEMLASVAPALNDIEEALVALARTSDAPEVRDPQLADPPSLPKSGASSEVACNTGKTEATPNGGSAQVGQGKPPGRVQLLLMLAILVTSLVSGGYLVVRYKNYQQLVQANTLDKLVARLPMTTVKASDFNAGDGEIDLPGNIEHSDNGLKVTEDFNTIQERFEIVLLLQGAADADAQLGRSVSIDDWASSFSSQGLPVSRGTERIGTNEFDTLKVTQSVDDGNPDDVTNVYFYFLNGPNGQAFKCSIGYRWGLGPGLPKYEDKAMVLIDRILSSVRFSP